MKSVITNGKVELHLLIMKSKGKEGSFFRLNNVSNKFEYNNRKYVKYEYTTIYIFG